MNLRFRDFLFPQRLLDETDAWDNPFVTHSRRRLKRWWRTAARALMAVVLLYMGWHMMFPAFENPYDLEVLSGRSRGWSGRRVSTMPQGGMALALWAPLFAPLGAMMYFAVVGFFSFLLLRYHLFVNDQSHHLKAIGHDQLEHLLLSRLGPNEYYLHHFLLFCLRYDVIVGWAALWLGTFATYVLNGGWLWIEEGYWRLPVMTLAIVLLTWVAGVFQYIMEWRLFAASRFSWLRLAVSVPVSALIALAITGFLYIQRQMEAYAIFLVSGAAFALFAGIAFSRGKSLYQRAEGLVWKRMIGSLEDTPSGVSSRAKPERITAFRLLWGILKPLPLYSRNTSRFLRSLNWKSALFTIAASVLCYIVSILCTEKIDAFWTDRFASLLTQTTMEEYHESYFAPERLSTMLNTLFLVIFITVAAIQRAVGGTDIHGAVSVLGKLTVIVVMINSVFVLIADLDWYLDYFTLSDYAWYFLDLFLLEALIRVLAGVAAGIGVIRLTRSRNKILRLMLSLFAAATIGTAVSEVSYWIFLELYLELNSTIIVLLLEFVAVFFFAWIAAFALNCFLQDDRDTPSLREDPPSSSESTLSPAP